MRSEIGVFNVFWLSFERSSLWNSVMFGVFSGIPALVLSVFYSIGVAFEMPGVFLAVAGAISLVFVAIPAAVRLLLSGRDESVPGAVSQPSDEIHRIYTRTPVVWLLF
jgi:uncharacterized membrane protein YjgN (DUF898 family)